MAIPNILFIDSPPLPTSFLVLLLIVLFMSSVLHYLFQCNNIIVVGYGFVVIQLAKALAGCS